MNQQTKDELADLIKGEVSDDLETIKEHSRDASLFRIEPAVVVFPKDNTDISNLIGYVNQHPDQHLSLTVRSGGTDMTGGPLGESIVINLNRHFNHLGDIKENHATVEPGVFYRDFEQATLRHNLLLPSYPASREICTVGGMVANNSGGEKTLSYGKTEDYVTELKVILRDGKEHIFRALTEAELEEKRQLTNFEGDIYRQMSELIEQNYDLLQQAKPAVSKNSAGYFLWNVYDKQNNTFDLTKLLVGSQGTLGIITETTFRLVTPKPRSQMIVMFLKDLSQLSDIVERTLRYHPESFESYDDHTLKIAIKFLPDLLKKLKAKNLIALGLQFLPEFTMILTGGVPKLILLAEFTGEDQAEVIERAKAAQTALADLNIKTRLTRNEKEALKYWIMRRESFNLLRHHVQNKRTAPFIDDIIVRPEQLPEFLPKLDKIMSHYDLTYTVAGHVGDANFHIIPLMNVSRPDLADIIDELSQKVYDLVKEYGGSITAEHNDGLVRTPFLEQMYGPEVTELFAKTKQIFDPNNIFNPGKKVASKEINWEYALDHLIKK